ncbi:hypothetical protein [Rhodococcus sp. G-MC3]|uniref:hypothetical protein n=1 Tax=Rhodococcus sp. G-MC3 TaxID=3046209 RepID=UPI003FA77044
MTVPSAAASRDHAGIGANAKSPVPNRASTGGSGGGLELHPTARNASATTLADHLACLIRATLRVLCRLTRVVAVVGEPPMGLEQNGQSMPITFDHNIIALPRPGR